MLLCALLLFALAGQINQTALAISLTLVAISQVLANSYSQCASGFIPETPPRWCKLEGPEAGRVDRCGPGFNCTRYMEYTEGVCCRPGNLPAPSDGPACPAGDVLRSADGVVVSCNGVCPPVQPGAAPIHVCVRIGGNPVCCPSQAHVCNSQAPSAGQLVGVPCPPGVSGSPPGPRYAYNSNTQQCSQFTYAGCGGNENRFLSPVVCSSFCANMGPQVAACPAGLTPSVPPKSCSVNDGLSCSTGYSCVLSGSSQVCCSGSPQCPNSPNGQPQTAYKAASAQNAQSCGPSVPCPNGFNCVPSTATGVNVCCQGSQDTCPNNAASNLATCNVNADNCPAGYFCHPRVGQNTPNGICCSGDSSITCPAGNEPSRENTGKLVVCSNGIRGCPSGATCMQSPTFPGVSICCQPPLAQTTHQCPAGFVYANAGAPQSCDIATNTCPGGARCLSTTATTGTGACCVGSAVTGATCGDGFVQQPTANFECSFSGGSGCQPGFQCTSAPGMPQGRGLCCAPQSTVLCSNGGNSYTDQQGRPRLCVNTPSQAQCPGLNGYTCTPSTATGVSICCAPSGAGGGPTNTQLSEKLAVCARNKVTAISNGAPYKCSRNAAANQRGSCPGGFECVRTQEAGYVCCSRNTATDTQVQCADNLPVMVAGSKISCSKGRPGTCNSGSCEWSMNVNGYAICCADQDRFEPFENCANGATPYIRPGSTARVSCSSDAQCGSPHYGCGQSVTGKRICCLREIP